jgi:putative SOS response-associated peptidase YedK
MTMNQAAVAAAVGVPETRWRDREKYRQRYNASPGSCVAVLRPVDEGDALAGEQAEEPRVAERQAAKELQTMRWGLVRSWTPADAKPDFFRAFNARSDTLPEKPMFNSLLGRKRCVVLLSAFYEFKAEGSAPVIKQPYLVKAADGGLLLAAGLYDRWVSATEDLYTCTILTKDAPPSTRWLHDRLPVFLSAEEADAWLDVGSADVSPERLLQRISSPEAGVELAWHPVSTRLNKGDVDDAACMTPTKREVERNAGSIAMLFANAGSPLKRKAADGGDAQLASPEAKVQHVGAGHAHSAQKRKEKQAPQGKGMQSLSTFFGTPPDKAMR